MIDIHCGDCQEVMKAMPDGCVDAVVTDPPAGIGFMGKYWDHHKGGRATWVCWLTGVMAECLRLAKPGAHALVWALPRTSHWTATAIEDAGWIIEDRIAHVFGQGFPKHKSKLKPAVEDWWLCTKPGGKKWLGVEACRVGTCKDGDPNRFVGVAVLNGTTYAEDEWSRTKFVRGAVDNSQGRWPTNLALTHHPDCVPCGTRRVKSNGRPNCECRPYQSVSSCYGTIDPKPYHAIGELDGMEAVAAWECHESCPVREMDRLSGASKSRIGKPRSSGEPGNGYGMTHTGAEYADSGGASRFFPTFAWQADDFAPFLYCGKATRKDRNEGCEGMPDVYSGIGHRGREPGTYLDFVHSAPEGIGAYLRAYRLKAGLSCRDLCEIVGEHGAVNHGGAVCNWEAEANRPTPEQWLKLKAALGLPDEYDRIMTECREVSLACFDGNPVKPAANHHPTVKPTQLMRWLCRLVTPEGGTILDPFMGSGSTLKAAVLGGFSAIGIESDPDYVVIAERRVAAARAEMPLFAR